MTMTQHACGGAVATTSAGRSLRARSSATYGSTAAVGKTTVKNATVAMPTNRRSSTALTTTCATNATYAHTSKKGLASFVERASGPQMKKDLIPFRVGMTVKVGVTVKEGNKTRVQPYEGVVIAIHRAGVATTVTVRKSLQGFGVERIFPVHSPLCTFEEIRGAGKPVVRIRFSSFLRVFARVHLPGARGIFSFVFLRGGSTPSRPRPDEVFNPVRGRGALKLGTATRVRSPTGKTPPYLRTNQRIVFDFVSLPLTGSSRQALLPQKARRQASQAQDALRPQEGGDVSPRDEDASLARGRGCRCRRRRG